MKTLETTIHYYALDLETPGHKAQYDAIVALIKANSDGRGPRMKAIPDPKHAAERCKVGEDRITLETEHLFNNQWNGVTMRVFDWWEESVWSNGKERKNIRRGHWLTITPEMAALRKETLKCQYCGKHYGPGHEAAPASGFCSHCLGNKYLKESELYMLRLAPISATDDERFIELTAAERDALVPVWKEMLRTCDLKRASAARVREKQAIAEKLENFKKQLEAGQRGALEEHDGMLWIWNAGFSVDNWIYYTHTRTFALGWREPVSDELANRWLEVASEFPFNYEIKAKNRELCKVRQNEPTK